MILILVNVNTPAVTLSSTATTLIAGALFLILAHSPPLLPPLQDDCLLRKCTQDRDVNPHSTIRTRGLDISYDYLRVGLSRLATWWVRPWRREP